jgi:hypothetical protein
MRFDKAEPRIFRTATYAAVAAATLAACLIAARIFGIH